MNMSYHVSTATINNLNCVAKLIDDYVRQNFSDQDGSRVATYSSTRYTGVSTKLYDAARRNVGGEFYLNVEAPGLGVFSTRSFLEKAEALQHMRDYYGFTQGL